MSRGGRGLPPAPAATSAHPALTAAAGCPTRSKERKELDRARKARRNKNFTLIQEITALWEEARRHDTSVEKRAKLVSAILQKVEGRLAELAGSHSASRIIQTCAKYGSRAGGLWLRHASPAYGTRPTPATGPSVWRPVRALDPAPPAWSTLSQSGLPS